jgi:hypothetical protein
MRSGLGAKLCIAGQGCRVCVAGARVDEIQLAAVHLAIGGPCDSCDPIIRQPAIRNAQVWLFFPPLARFLGCVCFNCEYIFDRRLCMK